MGWTKHIFWKYKIPVISLFTFRECSAAMEWGAWRSGVVNVNPGETHLIPGLPEQASITYQDIKRSSNQHPRAASGSGPPKPGDRPPWVPLVQGTIALMFNMCDDLERPFINYLANQMGLPVWGVGPLLPSQYWLFSNNTLIQEVQIRQPSRRQSQYTEDQVLQWLDKKQEKSVIYVAFGSEVSPTNEEILQLASALEEMAYPFIWVVQNSIEHNQENGSLNLDDLGKKIGDRGLIIRGWPPQLLIRSHPSTRGFLSHCEWNLTLDAIGCGVPILMWSIRGDQIYNAKLVVNHLKIGYVALPSGSTEMVKDDLMNGIEKLMMDEGVRKRADILRAKFSSGFPASSKIALETFVDFVKQNQI